MGVLRFFRRLGQKSILGSALILEEEIYNLYASLKEELADLEVPPSIVRIVDEEIGHQSLIRDMIADRIGEEEMERILEGNNLHIHDPEACLANRQLGKTKLDGCLPACTGKARFPLSGGRFDSSKSRNRLTFCCWRGCSASRPLKSLFLAES